jgi:hypothetical protein
MPILKINNDDFRSENYVTFTVEKGSYRTFEMAKSKSLDELYRKANESSSEAGDFTMKLDELTAQLRTALGAAEAVSQLKDVSFDNLEHVKAAIASMQVVDQKQGLSPTVKRDLVNYIRSYLPEDSGITPTTDLAQLASYVNTLGKSLDSYKYDAALQRWMPVTKAVAGGATTRRSVANH